MRVPVLLGCFSANAKSQIELHEKYDLASSYRLRMNGGRGQLTEREGGERNYDDDDKHQQDGETPEFLKKFCDSHSSLLISHMHALLELL